MTRGERVVAIHKRHGRHAGVVAVASTNGLAIGIVLDEPVCLKGGDWMLVSGALLFQRESEEAPYMDFWGEEWDVVAQAVS